MCVLISDAEWTALQERVEAMRPRACPQCGSDEILLTFLAPHEWECWACLATWSMAA